jgi:hypothetical protein
LSTTTDTGGDVAELPAASLATAVNVYDPSTRDRVLHLTR